MSEPLQKNKLYEYKANSNLVLEAERDKRRRDEGSAEVESLFGKLDGVKMGDRFATYSKDTTINESIVKKRKVVDDDSLNTFTFATAKSNVDENQHDFYIPKTRDTKLVYEEILSMVSQILGDQPHDVIRGAVDEVINLCRSNDVRESHKFHEIASVLGRASSEYYAKLYTLSKKLTDFAVADDVSESKKMDEEIGVAVVFDDEDEAMIDGNLEDEVVEDVVDKSKSVSQLKGSTNTSNVTGSESEFELSPFDIDAYWLQRQLSKYFSDANMSAKVAEDILLILSGNDERSIENKLVLLLEFDKFDFIKYLLRNKSTIYYCTKYRQAQNEDEKRSVEELMTKDKSGEGQRILKSLQQKSSSAHWAQDRIGEYTSKSRKEAQSLSDFRERNVTDHKKEEHDFSAFNIDLPQLTNVDVSPSTVIDLDTIQFPDGAHFMSNETCELPNKSWRALKKGYEEVHVPAIRPIIPPGETLVYVNSLPAWCLPAFEGIKTLNRIQSKMLNTALFGSENLLLCAPTGAGKTNVALLCMLNEIGRHRNVDGIIDYSKFKIVYVAPMKALVQEVVQSFSKKLAPFQISVRELSGDLNLSKQEFASTQVIVTTPEKWDIVTRKVGDRGMAQQVRLLIIDEIHLLHDDRGPVLEAIVARTLRNIENTGEMIRLVGLSATLPNYEDVAAFLRVHPDRGLFFFDQSYRPVPLQQQYIGITEKKAIKRFHLMNEICYEKVLQHAGKNQILIFTHSRAETVKTARALRDLAIENETLSSFLAEDSASKEILKQEAETSVKNGDLRDLLPSGFAIHHAGLTRSDRTLVEDLFSDKHIQVLVSTATLAWGVNLPCHTVIIKGTQIYSPEKGRWIEMSPLDILQMMGRAGRYGLDSEGEGIILTNHTELQYYLSLMNQQLPIESQLIKKLPDMLNAEIVLGNISTIYEASAWLGYTFLFIRMLKNPQLYGVDSSSSDLSLVQRRLDLVHSSAIILDKHGLIQYDRRSGCLYPNALGRVASYYYVSHESVKLYNDYLKPDMSEIEIFRLFSLSGEFTRMFVREEEKLELSKLVTKVPIPIKESIDETSAKVNVLLQSFISRLKLDGFSLCADLVYIQQSACRLLRALFEISMKRGWASLTIRLLNICKMAERKMWSSQSPLRQFDAIPDLIIRKIEKSTDLSWIHFFDLKPQDFGEMVKIPKMGKTLHKFVHTFPRLDVSANILPVTRSLLRIDLKISADFQYDRKYLEHSVMFWVFVHDIDGENLLYYDSFQVNQRNISDDIEMSFFVLIKDPIPPQYFIRVLSDRWLSSESCIPISLRNMILPSKFPPPTELLDLQPLPVNSLRLPNYNNCFKHIQFFNPIQTQVFSAITDTDNSLLISAPSGSDLKTCCELSILKYFTSDPSGKCVFISPREEVVLEYFVDWKKRFESRLGISIDKLTEDTAQNLKLLDSKHLILSSVDNFYAISKRWKQRKSIQNIGLYILDDLHMICDKNSVYEVLVSRCRLSTSLLEQPPRFFGLATCLANARDVGDWIGANGNFIFNFSPVNRPFPLEFHFVGFDNFDHKARMQLMMKPTFNILNNVSSNALVFVGTAILSKLICLDFLTYLQLNESWRVIEETPTDFDDATLCSSIQYQIAYFHHELSERDKKKVLNMFQERRLKALFVSFNCAQSLTITSSKIVLMDTIYQIGDHFKNYSELDILHVLKCAKPELSSNGATAYILCHPSKKDYLKKISLESIPIESQLHNVLHNYINTEISIESIENKQDAVDFLTWTFLYRRLAMNPNYYNMSGSSHRHLSDYLSDLVERVTLDLESAKCIAIDDDFDLRPLNLGMIADYYNIEYSTIELFSASLTAKSKSKGLLEIIASSQEFRNYPIRDEEWEFLDELSSQLNLNTTLTAVPRKVLCLIQAHISRVSIMPQILQDMKKIVTVASSYIPAMIDVISSKGWLRPALAAMELIQFFVQAISSNDSYLFQIPHFTKDIIQKFSERSPPVETIFDFIDLDDDIKSNILGFDRSKLSDVALFCNSYPVVEVDYTLTSNEVKTGGLVNVSVKLNYDSEDTVGNVIAPRFPVLRSMGWWLLIGDDSSNSLLAVKKINGYQKKEISLTFNAQDIAGNYNLALYLINDSYVGCDQEFSFKLVVS